MPIASTTPYGYDELYTGSLSLDSGSYQVLTYRSLEQLYYNDFNSGSGTIEETGSYDHFIESSFFSSSRFLFDTASVYSIPRIKVGTHIEPLTVELYPSFSQEQIDSTRYICDDYVTDTGLSSGSGGSNLYIITSSLGPYGLSTTFNCPLEVKTVKILDDGEGSLYISGSVYTNVGNVIYSHGQIILTDEVVAAYYIDNTNTLANLSWKSNLPIYTYNYNIKVGDYEYNFTQNPSAQSGSYAVDVDGNLYTSTSSGSRLIRTTGVLADNVTGSAFQPYITTVGLYNDANELLAVAKLGQPLPKSANTEMTIQIKLDI